VPPAQFGGVRGNDDSGSIGGRALVLVSAEISSSICAASGRGGGAGGHSGAVREEEMGNGGYHEGRKPVADTATENIARSCGVRRARRARKMAAGIELDEEGRNAGEVAERPWSMAGVARSRRGA